MNGIKVCGCCLSEDNLTEATEEPFDLISACFSIQVTNNVPLIGLPISICNICSKKLDDSYSFRCQIQESQNKLKNLFSLKNFNDNILMESDAECFKTEYLMEDLQSNNEETIDSNLNLTIENKEEKFSLINLPLEKEIKPVKKNKNNSPLKENYILSKIKKNLPSVSPKSFLLHKRLRNRFRYAQSIPFKLDKSTLACELCKETFSTHKFLVSHMAIHYPNYICDLCGKSFVLKSHLINHIKTHDMEKISCNVCSKLLKKSSMTRHLRTHTGNNNSYACPHCTDRFVSFNARVKHMEKMHNIDIYRYNCKICSKKFHLASNLSKHVRRCHFQELHFTCEECGKGFFAKKALIEHMLKHTGERNHHCNFCRKSYVRIYSLREHLKTHLK